MDERQLIQNPEALLALIQQAVQHLIEQRPDTAEQEAQLRAVAKAIEQLEKQRVPVPDSLRQTKMDLVAEIGQQAQFNRQLLVLGDGLTEVLEMIEEATGKLHSEGKPQKETQPRQRRSRSNDQPTTPSSVLRQYILQVLTELGGAARGSEVIEQMQEMLKDRLTPRDIEIYNNGQVVWKHNAHWERQHLVNKGILRNDSKFGYWELNQDHVSNPDEKQTYTSI